MNIIIAMMGETFENVQKIQEETGLAEQVQLMQDFLWLLNMKNRFDGKKYIVRVYPDESKDNDKEGGGAPLSAVKQNFTGINNVMKQIDVLNTNSDVQEKNIQIVKLN